jgi:hypothetical protein
MDLRAQAPLTEAGEGVDRTLVVRGESFHSTQDVIAYLQGVTNAKDRYSAQQEVLERMIAFHDRVGLMIEEVFDYIQQDGAYRAAITREEFDDVWQEVRAIVEFNRTKRDRLGEASRAATSKWDSEVVAWLGSVQTSQSFMANVRGLSAKLTVPEAARRVNRAMVDRLDHPRRGVSTRRCVQAADVTTAGGMKECVDVSTAELQRHGLRLGVHGFAEEGEVLEVGGAEGEIMPGPGDVDFLSPAQEIESMEGGGDAGSNLDGEFTINVEDDAIDEELYDDVNKELDGIGQSSGDELSAERPAKRRRATPSRCGCSSDVEDGWKAAVVKGRSYDMGTNLKLLRRMHGYRQVCYVHQKAVGGHMGLRVKMLKAEELRGKLQFLFDHQLKIGDIKTARGTFMWFRVKNRPARASDALGPYKFIHTEVSSEIRCDSAAILARIGVPNYNTWLEDGSINMNLFGWWFDTRIGEIVLSEFDMYRHHLREINGKSNYGWLRNMFYSIGQQLMRQDPVYYAAYAALRPDQQWRLVSYPYYAKYAVKGDATYFRHIDLNVPDLLASHRGANMIQGSVSLDDEDESSCTVILAGMQNQLAAWWDRIVERGQETNGFVHRITETMFTREDADALGVDWKKVPCKRGEVRITSPYLPHGADGPSTRTRRTMLPWFVGLQDDLTTLEVVEGGTWEMLSEVHRDLTAPRATPSGLANRYGSIPYKFPAAVEVAGLGALSDALVCRRRWDSPAVLRDRDTLLIGRQDDFEKYVHDWRKRAVAAAEEAFELVKEQEMKFFGAKSYFYHVERCERLGIPLPNIEPDEEGDPEDSLEGNPESARAGELFAEAP